MKIRPRVGKREREASPGSSYSSPTSCFGYCIPSPVLLGWTGLLQNLPGKWNEKPEQHICYWKALSLEVYTCSGKRGVVIWCWTCQAKDNVDQAKARGPSPIGSGRVWHGICAASRLAVGDDRWSSIKLEWHKLMILDLLERNPSPASTTN